MGFLLLKGDAAKAPSVIKVGEMYAGLHDDMQWYRCVVRKAIDETQVCYILTKITFRCSIGRFFLAFS